MAVDEDRRRAFGMEPVGIDRGMAVARQHLDMLEPGGPELRRDELDRYWDMFRVGGIGADARGAGEGAGLAEVALFARARELAGGRHQRPPLTDSTWPVIQLA